MEEQVCEVSSSICSGLGPRFLCWYVLSYFSARKGLQWLPWHQVSSAGLQEKEGLPTISLSVTIGGGGVSEPGWKCDTSPPQSSLKLIAQ